MSTENKGARYAAMKPITIYTTGYCPYCVGAKRLLDRKGLSYEEIRVDQQPARRQEMEARSQRRTVPQIFFGDRHIGGHDDLVALDRLGKFDEFLGERPAANGHATM